MFGGITHLFPLTSLYYPQLPTCKSFLAFYVTFCRQMQVFHISVENPSVIFSSPTLLVAMALYLRQNAFLGAVQSSFDDDQIYHLIDLESDQIKTAASIPHLTLSSMV